MERIWLSHYPPGVPAEVNVHEFASLKDVLLRSCQRFGALPAYSNMGASMTYAELDRSSRNFAAYLQKTLGLHKGDRVAIMMPNLLQYPVALFGVLRAGLVVVNVNPQYTAARAGAPAQGLGRRGHRGAGELCPHPAGGAGQEPDAEPGRHHDRGRRHVSGGQGAAHQRRGQVREEDGAALEDSAAVEFQGRPARGARATLDDVPLSHDDTAFLQYTGGTTGVAKGAVLTHGNLVANLQQLGAWIARDLVDGKEVFVCPLPLYHVYALTSSLVFMKIGAHTILITNPRDMHAFIHDLKKHRFTAIIGVNTLYRALLDAPEFADVDTRDLKMANAGGMAVQRAVAERWKQATGVPIIEATGLTETSPVVISNPLDIEEWTGTIGMPIPSTEAAILDDDGGEVAVGEVGEICVRGPQVMPGYWNRPDETAKVFTGDGWLRTGDMGFMDERGYFKITDRKKDMIVVSGFKVFPNQIEDVVAMHPGVAEVGAIGAPDEKSGEVVKIVVVRRVIRRSPNRPCSSIAGST